MVGWLDKRGSERDKEEMRKDKERMREGSQD